jgi:hypothetical protein
MTSSPMSIRTSGRLPPRDPNYSTVYQTVEEEQQKYWIDILDSTTDAIRKKAGIESNSTPNGGTDNSTMEFTKTLVEATVSAAVQGLRKTPTRTTTHAEQEQLNNSKSIMERYQITFARIEDVIDPTTNTTSKQVILPKLSDQFKQLLTGTKLPDAQRILQESMLTEIRKASESDDRVISACTLDVNQFDNVTTAALRNFNFSAQPLAADPSVVKRNITPFLFTTPPVHSVEYKERQLEGETYKYQVMIGEHSSKMDKRKTDLYYGENQVTANHVQECIANQFVFFHWVDPLEESEALGSSTPIVRRERMARPSRELSPSVPQPDRRSTQHALSVDLPCE